MTYLYGLESLQSSACVWITWSNKHAQSRYFNQSVRLLYKCWRQWMFIWSFLHHSQRLLLSGRIWRIRLAAVPVNHELLQLTVVTSECSYKHHIANQNSAKPVSSYKYGADSGADATSLWANHVTALYCMLSRTSEEGWLQQRWGESPLVKKFQ